VECMFRDEKVNFKTFDYKWKGGKNPWKLVEDKALSARLQELTASLYVAIGGQGYARTDIRMDGAGQLYMLDLNPNPSLFYTDEDGGTADMILLMSGYGKKRFLDKIIEFALFRQKKLQKNYKVQLDPKKGNCSLASRDLKEGELIYRLEEMPHRLVSKSYVEQCWNPRFKQFFTDFAYPLTDDLWVMWDVEPGSWKPLNHSCDPNSWVDGLNLVARKPIKIEEEITLDYATMYASDLGPKFHCRCGSKQCRGGWKPTDYLQPWFQERYGNHITDFVYQRKKLHGLTNSN